MNKKSPATPSIKKTIFAAKRNADYVEMYLDQLFTLMNKTRDIYVAELKKHGELSSELIQSELETSIVVDMLEDVCGGLKHELETLEVIINGKKSVKQKPSREYTEADLTKIKISRVTEILEGNTDIGFCLACGAEQDNVDQDAVEQKCASCGENKVFGADEILTIWV